MQLNSITRIGSVSASTTSASVASSASSLSSLTLVLFVVPLLLHLSLFVVPLLFHVLHALFPRAPLLLHLGLLLFLLGLLVHEGAHLEGSDFHVAVLISGGERLEEHGHLHDTEDTEHVALSLHHFLHLLTHLLLPVASSVLGLGGRKFLDVGTSFGSDFSGLGLLLGNTAESSHAGVHLLHEVFLVIGLGLVGVGFVDGVDFLRLDHRVVVGVEHAEEGRDLGDVSVGELGSLLMERSGGSESGGLVGSEGTSVSGTGKSHGDVCLVEHI